MPQEPHDEVLYRTRIEEHISRATTAELKAGRKALNIKRVSEEAGVPYQTLRWYMKAEIANPNYAVVDQVRRYLNQFHHMSSENYIYRADEGIEEGDWAAVEVG